MIEIKNSCCLHHVSGGNYSYSGDSNCPGCRGDWDDVSDKPVVNLNNWGGRYSGAFSVIGSKYGFRGTTVGYLAGTVIDVIDFQNLGENYKNNIMRELRNGNIPND